MILFSLTVHNGTDYNACTCIDLRNVEEAVFIR